METKKEMIEKFKKGEYDRGKTISYTKPDGSLPTFKEFNEMIEKYK